MSEGHHTESYGQRHQQLSVLTYLFTFVNKRVLDLISKYVSLIIYPLNSFLGTDLYTVYAEKKEDQSIVNQLYSEYQFYFWMLVPVREIIQNGKQQTSLHCFSLKKDLSAVFLEPPSDRDYYYLLLVGDSPIIPNLSFL